MDANNSEITSEMIAAGIDEDFLSHLVNQLEEWERSGELYDEFARRLAVLFWKKIHK